jgi:phosphoglycolate phosphatase
MWRLIVFDLDGTLVDSRQDIADAVNDLIGELGGRPLEQEHIVRMVGEGADLLVSRALAAAGVRSAPSDALQRFVAIYDRRLLIHTRTYPGIPEVLAEAAQLATLAVLTNKPEEATHKVLSGLAIARFFSHITGGDGPRPRKPAPDGLRHLMATAGTRPDETLLVGDSVVDLRTAAAAGVQICLARYGFGYQELPAAELHGEELFLDTPRDLLALLGPRLEATTLRSSANQVDRGPNPGPR